MIPARSLNRYCRFRFESLQVEPTFGNQASHLVDILRLARHVAKESTELLDLKLSIAQIQFQSIEDRRDSCGGRARFIRSHQPGACIEQL